MSNIPAVDFKYVGSELDLFSSVRNWKTYWSSQIRPFIGRDVLEAGAGIGSNTRFLDVGQEGCPRAFYRWVCLEPDSELLARLAANIGNLPRTPPYETFCGTLENLDAGQQFDTILYIDVLEHIEDDRSELECAASHLRSGGRIIVLAPAHQWLFTPFDQAIGHFRRYDRSMIRKISPKGLEIQQLRYLDCAGLAASIANRLMLRQSMPARGQLKFWDSRLVPVSRAMDKLLRYTIGKSIIAVWRRS